MRRSCMYLNPQPCPFKPTPQTPSPQISKPRPQSLDQYVRWDREAQSLLHATPSTSTLNPKSKTLNPDPSTLNPRPSTLERPPPPSAYAPPAFPLDLRRMTNICRRSCCEGWPGGCMINTIMNHAIISPFQRMGTPIDFSTAHPPPCG